MLYATDPPTENPERARVSLYARGQDYHRLMGDRLEALAEWLRQEHGIAARSFVDSQPVLERFWAWRAGLGWVGKNAILINRKLGSYFFLGGLLVDVFLEPDAPAPDHCGRCRKCIEACPTDAITSDRSIDSGKCIAYHTIENRGLVPESIMEKNGRWIAGCDICQMVCPWNDPVTPGPCFENSNVAFNASLTKLSQWAAEDFKQAAKGIAMSRMKYAGFVRNLAIALPHSGGSATEKAETLKRLEANAATLPHGPGRDGALAALSWAKTKL
jgi:epoxyqueuosine reductase